MTSKPPVKKPAQRRNVRKHAPWWGAGDPPHELWPGVSLEFKPEWSSARSRWETHGGRFYFDGEAADLAQNFFPLFLKHHIGEFDGEPFVLREDQAKLLTRPIFGYKRSSDGLRRFRHIFAFCVKGWGKSPWGSGTGLYLCRYDHEAAAEVYAVAADKQQARIVHEGAKIFVETSPELMDGCEILRDSIVWSGRHSSYLVISSDATTKHGFRPHAVIFDEFHAQRNRDLYEALKKSMAKRRQPLMVIITHAGTDDEGIAFEEYDLAKRVLAGNVNLETTLPVIFEMTPDDDWTDPIVWRRVNPGHGTTVKHDGIVQECEEAIAEPRKRNDFLRYHGNRWTNQATAWLPLEWWDKCEVTPLQAADLVEHPAAGGLDMAQSIDFASFVVLVRIPADQAIAVDSTDDQGAAAVQSLDFSIAVFPFFWLPEDRLREREKEDGLPLSLYRQRGQLFTSPGPSISADQVWRDIIGTIAPRFPRLRSIGYDPAFANDVAQRLSASHTTVAIPQNFNYFTMPCFAFEGLLKAGKVRQDGHPILRWNVSNVEVKRDEAGRIKPVKPRVLGQNRKRIDGVVALLIALGVLQREAPKPDPTYQVMFFGGKR